LYYNQEKKIKNFFLTSEEKNIHEKFLLLKRWNFFTKKFSGKKEVKKAWN